MYRKSVPQSLAIEFARKRTMAHRNGVDVDLSIIVVYRIEFRQTSKAHKLFRGWYSNEFHLHDSNQENKITAACIFSVLQEFVFQETQNSPFSMSEMRPSTFPGDAEHLIRHRLLESGSSSHTSMR